MGENKMIEIKTLEEARAATEGFDTTYFLIQKKKSANELHSGHVNTITEGRKFGNQAMVGFWYVKGITNFIKGEEVSEEFKTWDKNACVDWAAQNNIDIVWTPEYQDEINIMSSNLGNLRDIMDTIWINEKYDRFFKHPKIAEITKYNCLGKMMSNSGWKYTYSWKNGIDVFILKHFMAKYTKSSAVLLDPIKTVDNLYYSSEYFKFTEQEKEVIAQIEPMIMNFNLSKNIKSLDNSINILGKSINLRVIKLVCHVDNDVVGSGKKLVELFFGIDGETPKNDKYAFYF